MLKLPRLMLAGVLMLASGCAAHAQRVALQHSCDTGDQNACQQIAKDETRTPPPDYSAERNVGAPGTQIEFGTGMGPSGSLGGLGGLSGIGGISGLGGIGGIR